MANIRRVTPESPSKLSMVAATTKALAELEAVTKALPEVVVFEHDNFQGWEYRTNLAVSYIGDDWNDQISSIIVVSGSWRFYADVDFGGRYVDLRAGLLFLHFWPYRRSHVE